MTTIRIADLFCGAGGMSTGAVHLTQRADVAHTMREAA